MNKALKIIGSLLVVVASPTFARCENPENGGLPTLAQVKESGTLRSSYKNQRSLRDQPAKPKPKLAEFRAQIRPILKKACFQCHGTDIQEGEFRVDTLDPDLLHGGDVDWWLEVIDVLSNGEMPPEDEVELADEDRSGMIDWLSSEIHVASQVRRSEQGHSSFRRMTRYEYNHALQDLLGLPFEFAEDLPPETASEDGFTNTSEVLRMSAMQFGYYRELARKALERATVRGPQPEAIHYSITMEAAAAMVRPKYANDVAVRKERFRDDPERLKKALKDLAEAQKFNRNATHFVNTNTGIGVKASWRYSGAKYAWTPTKTLADVPAVSPHVAVIPAKQKLIVELGNSVPDSGIMRVRVRAARTTFDETHIPSLRLEFGWQASNNSSATESASDQELVIDAPPDAPQFYQWEFPLSEIRVRNPMRKTAEMGETPSPSEYLQLVNNAVSEGDIQIDFVEISAPVYEQWPPESHRRIFIDSPNAIDDSIYDREVLRRFMTRAWRRAVTDSDVDRKAALLANIRSECDDSQQAMIEVLANVLSSPEFLYLGGIRRSLFGENSNITYKRT